MTVELPRIGEVRLARELEGRSGKARVIWLPCPDCGKERWVYLHRGEPLSLRCTPCRGKQDREKTINALKAKGYEIKTGEQLGKIASYKYQRYIKRTCACGEISWILLIGDKPANNRCRICAGKARRGPNSGKWKGGRRETTEGYIEIYLASDDFFYPMVNKRNTVMEHRLIMAKHLGRCLHLWEIVHHKGTKYPKDSKKNKQDNRIENLQLVTDERHQQITIMENRIKHLEARVTLLEAENALLKGLEVR